MLDQEDLKWIATTSTELNSMLQQISRYSDLARQHKGEHNYVELLGERVELASKRAQELFDRVTSRILAGSSAGIEATPSHQPFSVVPDPVAADMQQIKSGRRRPPAKPLASVARPTEERRLAPIPTDIPIFNAKGNRELILLVDDETEIAELASEMLAEEGYKVVLAKDGFEALRVYQQIGGHIGLVVLDFFLPVMDGDAVFDELRALNPNINVVLSSGFAEQSKVAAMLEQGLRGFIPKPYTREKLLEQVRSTLDASHVQSR